MGTARSGLVVVLGVVAACAADTQPSTAGAGSMGRVQAPGSSAGTTGFDNSLVAPPDPTQAAAGAQALAGQAAGGPCAQGVANASPVIPTVWLVLDGSGSMDENFDGGSTRWQTLRSTLMGAGGIVPTLERGVRFGMVLYSGIDQEPGAQGGLCVDLAIVDPALNNFATLDASFPQQELGGWTPTDRALEHVVNNLPGVAASTVEEAAAPVFVILATDGAPNDHCTGAQQDNNRGSSGMDPVVAQRVIAAADRGAQIGMQLFVISLAGGDAQLQQHLDEVAATSLTGVPPFVPASRDDLAATLQQIVGNATCRVELDGSVTLGDECAGEVLLNGNPLGCNSDDGFRMIDERTLQLTGTACDSFLGSDSQVYASFPCGVFVPD